MNVSQICVNTIKSSTKAKQAIKETVKTLTEESKTSGGNIVSDYAKAAINIESKLKEPLELSKDFFNKLLEKDEHIGYSYFNRNENVARIRIGKEISGFKGLYKDDKYASCYFNKAGEISHALLHDNKTGITKLFDLNDNTIHVYSKNDIEALRYYKYHPDAIHAKLRFGKDKFRGSFQDETIKVIEDLRKLFSDDSKLGTNVKPRKLYRALQSGLSTAEKKTLSTKGGIFTEKSFCSTTTDLDVAKRFARGNPILEITMPEGAKYIDIEKLFNIDRAHWHEEEFLLNANSKFKVTDFDSKNNTIHVEYIP